MSFARNAINLVLAPRAKPLLAKDLGEFFNVSSGSSGSVEILLKVDAGASGQVLLSTGFADAGKTEVKSLGVKGVKDSKDGGVKDSYVSANSMLTSFLYHLVRLIDFINPFSL